MPGSVDPISAGIGGIGLGLSIISSYEKAQYAKQAAEEQQQISGLEQGINDQKRVQMELSASRQQMEIFRNAQRLRAQSTQAAVNQGAQYGSGLQGGLAGVTAGANWNAQGVSQNLQIGENIFGLTGQISQHKQSLARIQGEAATWGGIGELGGTLSKGSGTISDIYGWATAK